jgi:hypothetical protein
MGETWEDQYRRMKRHHAQLLRVADQTTHHADVPEPDAAHDVLIKLLQQRTELAGLD